MAIKTNISTLTTYEPARTIEPIYTGGDVSANQSGSLLATCVEEDVLVVETSTGRPLCRVEGDGEATTSLCLSPDALHLVVCSRSLAMRIYAVSLDKDQTASVELLRTLKPHTTPVVSSAIDATGSLVATGGADGSVKVWDLRGGFATHSFHPHGGVVSAVAFSRPTLSPVSNGPDATGKRGNKRAREASSILLASGAEDGRIRIHDLNNRKLVTTLESHVSVVRNLEFSSDGQRLLSNSRDRTIILWNTNTWKSERVILALEVLEAAGFFRDYSLVYAAGERGLPRVWSVASGQELTAKPSASGLETDAIVSVVSCPKDSLLITIHQDQSLRFYSYATLDPAKATPGRERLNLLRRMTGSLDEVIDMGCVGVDRSLLALATNTESVKVISIDHGGAAKDVEPLSDDPAFGSDVGLLEGHSDIVISLGVDWSGNWLATGAKDNTARLWRIDSSARVFECVAVFEGHAESIGAVALPQAPPSATLTAKDGLLKPPQYLLTGSQDKTVKKWDTSKIAIQSRQGGVQSGFRAAFTRVAHEKDINALDVSESAPIFASASQDKTIKIWSLEDGSVTGILRGHKRGVWSVKFSPAGAAPLNLSEGGKSSSSRGVLVSGSGDRTVKVWSLSTYSCLLTFEGHANSVLKVLWIPPPSSTTATAAAAAAEDADSEEADARGSTSPYRPVIASASSDTLVKLWTPWAAADADHLLATLDNHRDRVWALASPAASAPAPASVLPLISGAADATITFWRDTSRQTATRARQRASQRVEQDQQLQNHLHARNYREAITLALALNHPGRLLRIFQDVAGTNGGSGSSITGDARVDRVLAELSPHQVYGLLERVRDWNTNARTAPVAQRVLHCLLKSYPAAFFVDDLAAGAGGDAAGDATTTTPANRRRVKDLLRALEVYTERHYRRIEDLVDESYLVEYTLREMDEVL